MDLGDRIKHTAEVAKWKASQQKRLMDSKNLVSKLKNEIRNQKVVLADHVLSLYEEGQLSGDDLEAMCDKIVELKDEVGEQISLQKRIKDEKPPERPQDSAKESKQQYEKPSGEDAGSTCPNCNRAIPDEASFCTHCGKPIPVTDEKNSENELKICPSCESSIPVKADFCPECGNRIPKE